VGSEVSTVLSLPWPSAPSAVRLVVVGTYAPALELYQYTGQAAAGAGALRHIQTVRLGASVRHRGQPGRAST
jgi:hypothetical protein